MIYFSGITDDRAIAIKDDSFKSECIHCMFYTLQNGYPACIRSNDMECDNYFYDDNVGRSFFKEIIL